MGGTLWFGAGCPRIDPFACERAEQCVLNGEQGVCDVATDRCAYPDADCPSSLRFPSPTDQGLAGTCVPPTGGGSSSGDSSPVSTTGSGSEFTVGGPVESSEGDGTTSSPTTGPGCVLQPSMPLAFDGESDLIVEQLSIDARATGALRIRNSPGAVVRDLEVKFSGNAGLVIEDSPGVVVERIHLINAGVSGSGAAAAGEVAVRVERSSGIQIRHVFARDPRSGIVVIDSDDVVIEDIVVQNSRGEINTDGEGSDEGGDCVLLQRCDGAAVRRFGCTNEPDGFEGHAGVFVDRSSHVVVEEGIASEFTQQSGVGVRVHTTDETSTDVLIRAVHVVGGTHACFDILGGREVTLEDTGCRNNEGTAWLGSFEIEGPMRAVGGRYYEVGEVVTEGAFVDFCACEDQFVPRLPPDVRAPCSDPEP